MHSRLLLAAILFAAVASAAKLPPSCPRSCECRQVNGQMRVACTSLAFVDDLNIAQAHAIEALDLSSGRLRTVDVRRLAALKQLRELNLHNNSLTQLDSFDGAAFPRLPHLKRLVLSQNQLRHVPTDVPKTVQFLDVRWNRIEDLDAAIMSRLHALQHLLVEGNPLRCDRCANLGVRDALLSAGVTLSKRAKCYSGGELFLTAECSSSSSASDVFLGDEAVVDGDEGSGYSASDDQLLPTTVQPASDAADSSERVDHSGGAADDSDLEGSGFGDVAGITTTTAPVAVLIDDDYDDESNDTKHGHEDSEEATEAPTVVPHGSACVFDCASDADEEQSGATTTEDPFAAASPPGILDGIRMVLGDLTGKEEPTTTTTTSEPEIEIEATEAMIVKEHVAVVEASDKDAMDDVEVIDATKETDELQRQSVESAESSSITTYLVIGGLAFIMVCLVIYSLLNKRGRRAASPPHVGNGVGGGAPPARNGKGGGDQELKDFTRNADAEGGNASPLPEKVPLINGHHGEGAEAAGEHEKLIPERSGSKLSAPDSSGDDVELRLGKYSNESLPSAHEAHRVTVQARELITPKTPLLVNRSRSGDGTIIVTTPTANASSAD